MPDSQGARREFGESADGRRGVGGEAAGLENVFCLAGGLHDIVGCEGWTVAALVNGSPQRSVLEECARRPKRQRLAGDRR